MLWIAVSRDKYELPIAVADSIEELAELCGVKVNSIRSYICHARQSGKRCKYVAIEVEDAWVS